MTDTMIGKMFSGRYKIIERIGIGGMAEVYRAEDTVLGRIVAVKVMLPQYAADPTFAQRFRQEAASAANLQSPYIVNIYDWGQDDGTYYIVMEYVRGSDLKTGIKERGAINQRKVAEIGSQVCQALSVAHKQDIIHRDIKPQNIMIQPDGNVKVMDFGIARAKNSVAQKTSSVLGTAHYISPEQAQGKELTPASDIYSLGIVLYEAVTGKLPFDAEDAIAVAMMQVKDTPRLPSEYNPAIDPDFEAIICKAMEKDPKNRFATALEMRAELNNFLAGRPVNVGLCGDATRVMPAAGATQVMGGRMGAAAAGAAVGAGVAGAGMAGAGMAGAGATTVMPGGLGNQLQNSGTMQPVDPKTYSGNTGNGGQQEKKSPAKTIGIVVGIIAAIAIIAFIAMNFLGGNEKGVEVPDVTNMTQEQAVNVLEDAGFKLGNVTKSYNDKVEAGKVISQDPTAKTKHPEGTKVNLVISQGGEKVTVPDLKNMTAKEAQEALTKLGLKSRSGEAKYSNDIEEKKIMDQDPAAGSEIGKGETVTYILSLGPESIAVPNLVNYTRDEAISTLKEAGFEVAIEQDYSDSVSEGYVLGQKPNSGTKLKKGDTVTIIVSLGQDPEKQKVDVPNVVGMTMADAASKLQNAGLGVSKAGNTADNAKVASQDVTGRVQKGTTVTITGAAANQ